MKPIMPTKRIEYIDAMRGFTMLLVVMAHVVTFGIGRNDGISFYFSDIFQTFRMPLFFFVSGFVFYVANKKWTKEELLTFFQKKIPVQILSPFIFFIIFTLFKDYNIINGLIDPTKYGYWFTFALFSYFVIYLCVFYICKLFRFSSILFDILLCTLGLGMFMFMRGKYIGDSVMATTLGLVQCKYFIFFCLGTLSRKHFSFLEGLLDKIWFLPLMIITFALLTLFPIDEIISSRANALLLGTTGIIIVFATFRHYQETFCSERKIGRICQFVGRRTLDIYLIHYFFVWDGLTILQELHLENAPILAFVVTVLVACVIIALSLMVSQIIRISPILAHWLFGAKKCSL